MSLLGIKRAERTFGEAVDIGTVIAYKHGDRPWGQFEERRTTMATKKLKKATKKLKKAKKLQPTKPLLTVRESPVESVSF